MSQTRRGLLVILSSPSGAGKSTLARRLMAWDPTLSFSVSATTRAPRPGEVDGREYYFLSRAQFEARIEAGEMLEHAEVFGNFYGSPRAPVETALAEGRDVLFDVDWQGAQQIRTSALGDDALSIFILPPSIPELERRLHTRAQDSEAVIAGRMSKARDEISHWAEYDYVLVNADVDRTEAQLRAVIEATRLRRRQQPWLGEHVRRLNKEFDTR
ncbi:guanylate kinase [Phaeovulum vinaykumarii]|uniref:Guanylate kinase n=1 Tax=Phaeovulum vinaykumarii TaxID=407234 RepID=A0A1N7LIH8_9RHOB|nr:guanylate kinase [Phaeovulum vinaykumarii]SIS73645.1 guanylate kinase [Phaeovulum vinaykumarii]SOC04736.1 guanylate kinase [Phaeovulum vinaykumarii]